MPNARRTIFINPKVVRMLALLFRAGFLAVLVRLFIFITCHSSLVLWQVCGRLPPHEETIVSNATIAPR